MCHIQNIWFDLTFTNKIIQLEVVTKPPSNVEIT